MFKSTISMLQFNIYDSLVLAVIVLLNFTLLGKSLYQHLLLHQDIEEDMIRSWIDMIASIPRPVQLMTSSAGGRSTAKSSANHKAPGSTVNLLRRMLADSVPNVKLHSVKVDRRLIKRCPIEC